MIGIDISVIEVDKNNELYLELKRVIKDVIIGKVESEFFDY